jgi:hypothetical protein
MPRFWLATFTVAPPAADEGPAAILAPASPNLAIEVLGDPGGPEYAVLLSTVDDPRHPRALTCLLGFTNAAKACNIWHDRGFPLVDARIERDKAGTIRVFSPYFGGEAPMRYDSLLLTMTGMAVESPPGAEEALETRYDQVLAAPDAAQPDLLITRRATAWTPQRSGTYRLKAADVQVDVAPSRYPSLAPLGTRPLTLAGAWSGQVVLPEDPKGANRGAVLDRVNRAAVFGPPAFRFENVEVLGFRIDLGAYGRDFGPDLDDLIRPLNFHLESTAGAEAVWDFRYRAATGTLLIELLRYGSMRLKSPSPPMGLADYQSQHELVVRLLVGRVDDDTAQAHAPAVYVPAIFVDNPWSKVVGRDLQGFDKRMANFCVRQDGREIRLLPDGRVAGGAESPPRPLGDISVIRLVEETGSLKGPAILELDCSPASYEDWDAFDRIDLGLALRGFSLVGTRWRQGDFDAAEFRRSFARSAVADSLRGFRSIQVSPVAERGLDRAWITGTFTVDEDLRIARPSGVASLIIHAARSPERAPAAPSSAAPAATGTAIPAAPRAWNLLCKMLGDGDRAQISLPTGSWYRLVCSMDLTIDDGLDWTSPGS